MATQFDLVCFSHLRWDFVYQRPNHLMSRCALARRVFFIEEPLFDEDLLSPMVSLHQEGMLHIVTPHLPIAAADTEQHPALLRSLLDGLFERYAIETYACWYYTPMALAFSRHLEPIITIYDCMDELSAFTAAPPAMRAYEAELMEHADLVFTGGHSLYAAKRRQHPHVFAFPSSVDVSHFAQARAPQADPADQQSVPHPRLGFFGVIDERMDLALLAGIADTHPDWHLVLIGPIAKVTPDALPQHANIHYLGKKTYAELPAYLAGWDVALIPFAHNASTRFISPTKTPEYLAAGKPVVATAIADVVAPYGEMRLVHIADTVDDFVTAIQMALDEDHEERLQRVDAFLADLSWDNTWQQMRALILEQVEFATITSAIVTDAAHFDSHTVAVAELPASAESASYQGGVQ